MPPKWLLLLCAYLLVWVPVNFSALAIRSLPSIGDRGGAAAIELSAHAAATALCAAAGWMLKGGNAAGVALGYAALVVNAAVTIQALFVSALPRDVAPGAAWPFALVTVAHTVIWALYISRSRRLRAWVGQR
jgi:hypothetical protein